MTGISGTLATPFGEVRVTVHNDDNLHLDAESIVINRVSYRLRGHFIRGTEASAKKYAMAGVQADGSWYAHPQGFDIQKVDSVKYSDFSWNAYGKAKDTLTDLVNAWDKTPEGWTLLSTAVLADTEDKLIGARRAVEEARNNLRVAEAAVVDLEREVASARVAHRVIHEGVAAR